MSYARYATSDYRRDISNMYNGIMELARRYEIYPEYIFEDLYDKHLRDY